MDELPTVRSDALIAEAQKGDDERRRSVAWELARRAKAGDLRCMQQLIQMLPDAGDHVSEAAADALTSIGQGAVAPLIDVLENHSAPSSTRMAAATALYRIPSLDGTGAMSRVLGDASNDVSLRRLAAHYLGVMRGPGLLDALLRVATQGDEDGELRLNAIAALGTLKDQRAIGPLSVLLLGADSRVLLETVKRELLRIEERRKHASPALRREFDAVMQQEAGGRSLHEAVRQALREIRPADGKGM